MSTHPTISRSGRFSEAPSALMQRFSESVSFDARLAPYDIAGSKAHAAMLARVGLLSTAENSAIQDGLDRLLEEIQAGRLVWKMEEEDVHMNIEKALRERVPAAAKLHTARSRNDQVATDMRLFFKDACRELANAAKRLMETLLACADKHQEIAVPGYTHLQRGQPVSLAHHWLAYVEMFGRDRDRFLETLDHANWCPLGSGALAGSTLPIDRAFTAKALGFVDDDGQPRITRNSLDAVADRDVYCEFAFACAQFGVHASRVAEDLVLWSSVEFGLIWLPEAFTTGSSLMPQKKNPDACELLRGKSARLQGNLHTLLTLVKGLPLTYNRDLQEDKPPVFDSFEQTLLCLEVLNALFDGMEVNEARCRAAVNDPLLLATDLADLLVLQGMPFREAHHAVGALVALAEQENQLLHELPLATARTVVPQLPEHWQQVFSVERALAQREKPGMPGPQMVAAAITDWKVRLS